MGASPPRPGRRRGRDGPPRSCPPQGLVSTATGRDPGLGDDLGAVWDAPTNTSKDRKQLLRTLLDEVNITLRRDDPDPHAGLVLRWKGGAISELTVPLRRP